jgi:hypothetical protein
MARTCRKSEIGNGPSIPYRRLTVVRTYPDRLLFFPAREACIHVTGNISSGDRAGIFSKNPSACSMVGNWMRWKKYWFGLGILIVIRRFHTNKGMQMLHDHMMFLSITSKLCWDFWIRRTAWNARIHVLTSGNKLGSCFPPLASTVLGPANKVVR